MKLVVQRVNKAIVKTAGEQKTIGRIGKGLFILLAVSQNDDKKTVSELAQKLVRLRIMADKKGKMNLSVKDVGAEILVVSQFTLFADTSGGNRPSFIKAAEPGLAKKRYIYFIETLKKEGVKVETGSFGHYMKIKTELDGPVTIILEK